ncbi:hypothetical protein C8R44DRAFT_889292 [Mycena epipterygia]|nr:hypothetical protein C8R44DRAFT_889292 [Mycena epipterygia]
MRDGRVVFRETEIPDEEARHTLRVYLDAYDAYSMKHGTDYHMRNPDAKATMQAAEQRWHDWIVFYLAACGRPGRPDWALQPLPGLQRVCVMPAPRAVEPATQPVQRRHVHLPTPPPSSPVRPLPSSPAPFRLGSLLRPINIADDNDNELTLRRPEKRKFLGVINISDDEEDLHPHKKAKKARFLGVVDLTNEPKIRACYRS